MTIFAPASDGAGPSFAHKPGGQRLAWRYEIHVNCAADPSGRVFAYDYLVGVRLSVIVCVLPTLTSWVFPDGLDERFDEVCDLFARVRFRLCVIIGDAIILHDDLFILEVWREESPGYIVTLNSHWRTIGSSGALLYDIQLCHSGREVSIPLTFWLCRTLLIKAPNSANRAVQGLHCTVYNDEIVNRVVWSKNGTALRSYHDMRCFLSIFAHADLYWSNFHSFTSRTIVLASFLAFYASPPWYQSQ